jgi:hypothetical protein
MAANRIYLGIDTHSNLAVSLEHAGHGVFFITVSAGAKDKDLCKFLCTEEDLNRIVNGETIEVKGCAGRCTIHPLGTQIVFEFLLSGATEPSSCSIALNSFERVVRLAKNRAYVV